MITGATPLLQVNEHKNLDYKPLVEQHELSSTLFQPAGNQWLRNFFKSAASGMVCLLIVFFLLLLFDFHIDAPIFCLCLCWIGALFGGWICDQLGLPSLLGMLIMGILLKNIPGGLVDELPPSWASKIRAIGLCLILLRSGLEIEVSVISRIGMLAFLLTVIPSVVEAAACGPLGYLFFNGMPLTLGWSMGFILSSVSGAVVVVLMFNLQKEGWGRAQGIPTLIMAASSFDDIIAIGGYTVFIAMASASLLNTAALAESDGQVQVVQLGWKQLLWTFLSGPVSFVVGLFIGWLIGLVSGMTKIFSTTTQIVSISVILTQIVMMISGAYGHDGIGAMAALGGGVMMVFNWQNGLPSSLSVGPAYQIAPRVESKLSAMWGWIAQPLLFVVIGAAVDVRTMDQGTLPRALGLLACSLSLRLLATYLCLLGSHLNFKERIYVTLAWLPKATIQAALSSAPLDVIKSLISPENPVYAQYEQWGIDILCTCLISVLFTAPLGLIVLTKLAPVLLTQDAKNFDESDDGNSEPGGPIEEPDIIPYSPQRKVLLEELQALKEEEEEMKLILAEGGADAENRFASFEARRDIGIKERSCKENQMKLEDLSKENDRGYDLLNVVERLRSYILEMNLELRHQYETAQNLLASGDLTASVPSCKGKAEMLAAEEAVTRAQNKIVQRIHKIKRV